MKRVRLVFALGLSLLAVASPGAQPTASVEKTLPRVVYRVFDPMNPPAEMKKKLIPPEAGLCEFEFGCVIQTGVELPRFGFKEIPATISSIRLVARLSITIWTVVDAPPKLRAHEEAHREICELYYQKADKVAVRLAQQALGRKLPIPTKHREAAAQEALDAFQNELLAEFLKETATPCTAAQERFDAITAHGLDPIGEADAIARAMDEKGESPEKKPKP